MNKKHFALFLAILMIAIPLLGACGTATSEPIVSESVQKPKDTTPTTPTPPAGDPDDNNQEPEDEDPTGVHTYPLNSYTEGIKIMGVRHLECESRLYVDWTGSGVEFNVTLNSACDITFTAGSIGGTFFKAYVDGTHWKNGEADYYSVTGDDVIIMLESVPAGDHTIRLVKATGYTLSRAHLWDVTIDDGIMKKTAPADKDLYIEFLGDSISCGWGTIGGHTGAYTDQDGTLAYPYLVAEALDADYSIMALSGKGVIFGSPNFQDNYLHASPLRTTDEEYSFERKADIVVINLGTNERGNHADAATFGEAYLELLEQIFEKNGTDCVIYCVWGAMNDAYCEQIQDAIFDYKKQNDEGKIYTIILDKSTQTLPQAYGHPTIADNQKYLATIKDKIDKSYNK